MFKFTHLAFLSVIMDLKQKAEHCNWHGLKAREVRHDKEQVLHISDDYLNLPQGDIVVI